MQKPRRSKTGIAILILIVLTIPVYIFRYPLVLKFQHARLRSLGCSEQSHDAKYDCWQKICVHRVNSLPRYDLLRAEFSMVESDLNYNPSTGTFSIYHPPITKEGDTLSLVSFLRHADLEHTTSWFDTRFVGASNMQGALEALSRLDDTIAIKKNCVFELYDASAAAFFAQRGYRTSFNASEEIQQGMQKDPAIKDSINKKLEGVSYVSQDARYLPVIKEIFPEKPIVTWELKFSNFFNRGRFHELLNDPRVAILMVNIKTPFYR